MSRSPGETQCTSGSCQAVPLATAPTYAETSLLRSGRRAGSAAITSRRRLLGFGFTALAVQQERCLMSGPIQPTIRHSVRVNKWQPPSRLGLSIGPTTPAMGQAGTSWYANRHATSGVQPRPARPVAHANAAIGRSIRQSRSGQSNCNKPNKGWATKNPPSGPAARFLRGPPMSVGPKPEVSPSGVQIHWPVVTMGLGNVIGQYHNETVQ